MEGVGARRPAAADPMLTTVSAPGRAWRHQLVHRQLPISILIECLERCRSVGDFIGVDHAIVVGVQRDDDRGKRTVRAETRGARSRQSPRMNPLTGCYPAR